MVAPLHMVVVEGPSADSNERLKSSLEKGERLHRSLWRALVCIVRGMLVPFRLGLHAAWHCRASCVRLRCGDGRTGRVVVSGLGWWYGVVSKRDTTTQNLLRAYRLQRQGGGGGGLFASSYVFCMLPCISLFFIFFH